MSKRSEDLVTNFEIQVRHNQRMNIIDPVNAFDTTDLEFRREQLVKYILELERKAGII